MTIDKSWITITPRFTAAFKTGLNAFIERCENHLNDHGRCYCPCKKCGNTRMETPKNVRIHIVMNGFDTTYTTWTYHGQAPPPIVYETSGNPIRDFLQDVQRENIDETADDIGDHTHEDDTRDNNEAPPSAKDDLEELFEYAEQPLFPGCTWLTTLDFVAKLSHMKVMNKWTDSSFDQLLEFLRFSHPRENTVPKSQYEAKRLMKKVGLGYESIHACKNDCCLFWAENEFLDECPVCNESRWKDKDPTGKRVANKILRYFPLTPRLKRLYSSRHTAKSMTWHATGKCTEKGKLRHPVDGASWQAFDQKYPEFSVEPRNVRLGLAADGFNPYGNMSLSYSMWPVILTTYNTPPWVCMKETSLMLTLLIPGPKSPGKDFDVYLRPLVDELKKLWSEGVRTNDAATGTQFTMRAMLLWTINDFPARSSLSGWSGQGYKACPTCNIHTPSVHVQGKTAYVGHRRFLPTSHRWRRDKRWYNKNDLTKKPEPLTPAEIEKQIKQLATSVPGKPPVIKLPPNTKPAKRKRNTQDKPPKLEHNWRKCSIFRELVYFPFLDLPHNLDVMHIEKNVCESLLGTLLMNDKSKDTQNARRDLEKWGIREDLWLTRNGNTVLKPHPKFSFTQDARTRFCQFIKEVKLPDGFGSRFKRKVSEADNNITGMKSHDCHIMMQRLLPVGVRGCLDENISTPIIELCSFFKQICARELMVDDMLKAQKQLVELLCTFELIFPPAFFDIMIHLVMHLPQEAIQGGPVYMRWMYPFERYMKKLKHYVRNKARPEGCIAEGYVADEALTFCSRSLTGVTTRFNRPERNDDTSVKTPCKLYVFQSLCKTISKGVNTTLSHELRKNVHWYVLNNCPDVEDYKK